MGNSAPGASRSTAGWSGQYQALSLSALGANSRVWVSVKLLAGDQTGLEVARRGETHELKGGRRHVGETGLGQLDTRQLDALSPKVMAT